MSADAFLAAMAGRYDGWWWSTGMSPEVIGDALGVRLAPAPARFGGCEVLQTVVAVDSQPFPVRLRWTVDRELALVTLSEPAVDPSWDAVLTALGEPDVVYEHGRGPVPGGDQLCHLDRGLTVFDSGDLGYQAVWLYPPLAAGDYPGHTGAFEPIRRVRR
jgi:hypothetical protein